MSYRRFGRARSLHSDRAEWTLGRCVAIELRLGLGRYVATELRLEIGRYVATERNECSVAMLQPSLARARSLRSDRAEWTLGRYVVTGLWLELGRYVAI
ncbi:hypothetical protein DY000_02020450 [Brassica cretica]|uniref:Uncharacterized protein n=1 Tax=Brassica cretica TaxID=69181 RepID=A0ABQ7E4K7_BRACR|nr:hypothetical protein DY000_02020450 [Brassica cretica]